jgi:sugar/nucleoside kinase (ribokinase family)
MTITVLGHLCIDAIVSGKSGGAETEAAPRDQFGGILYAVAALANLMADSDEVIPVFGVGAEDHDRLMDFLSAYPNVETKGIYKLATPTNRVHLIYESGRQSRIECSRHISDPIPFERIKPFLNVDGVLVNMISGQDITLATLDAIRMETRDRHIPIHLDIHSLSQGIGPDGTRFRRPVIDWRRWCFMLHSIQMSEEEAAGLTSERYDETQLINQLMPLMVESLLITRGPRGATLIRQEHKTLTRHDLPGMGSEGAAHPTGCGDVFGAAYLSMFVKTKDPVAAARYANRAAARKAQVDGPGALRGLGQALAASEAQEPGGI